MNVSARAKLARVIGFVLLLLLGATLLVSACVRQTNAADLTGERAPARASGTVAAAAVGAMSHAPVRPVHLGPKAAQSASQSARCR